MDPITLVVGAVLLLTGGVIGRTTKRREKPKTPSTICGCRHQLAMHDPETGRCHDMVKGDYIGHYEYANVQCGCRQYTGARPIDQFYTPRSIT